MLTRWTYIVFVLCLGWIAAVNAEAKPVPFHPFTGKIIANKVRLRTSPDLDSHILKQLNQNDLVLVVDESADFWAVEPPVETKAYVYRTYILDDIVEADRVNVRLEPSTTAPVIGKLEKGTHIHSKLCKNQTKWLEIAPPKSVRFYVAKEYISKAGGPDFFVKMIQREQDAQNLIRTAISESDAECQKAFTLMDPNASIQKFEKVIHEYKDFPKLVEQAKVALAILKDNYTQKKIAYLEDQNSPPQDKNSDEEDPFAKFSSMLEDENLANPKLRKALDPKLWTSNVSAKGPFHPTFRHWEAVENSLYKSWSEYNENKRMNDFYDEQKANAILLTGVIEKYDNEVQNKPGNYVLKSDLLPVAYLYSTHVNLKELEGKKVKVSVSPRPNNKFAFPAFFVLEAE